MKFTVIDKENWDRKEYFEHYFSGVPCTYSMSVKLDITEIKNRKKKLYPTMLYFITTIVNRHDEFRTSFNAEGQLGVYDEMIPCYTIFHKIRKLFPVFGPSILTSMMISVPLMKKIWKNSEN